VYCGKCCAKSKGLEVYCRSCGHQLCSDPGPDNNTRTKAAVAGESERTVTEKVVEPTPELLEAKKEKSKKKSRNKERQVYAFYPAAGLRKIFNREPVELGPKDYAVLLLPFCLVALEMYLFYAMGPMVIKHLNLETAVHKIFNIEQTYFGQNTTESQLVGLWELNFDETPALKQDDSGFTKSQAMFTDDHMMRVAMQQQVNGETIVLELEGAYTLKNMVLSAQLMPVDDYSESIRVSCLIEIEEETLSIVWVSGFAFDHNYRQLETRYYRVDANQSLFP